MTASRYVDAALFPTPTLTAGDEAVLAEGLALQQAQRDLRDLVTAGLLVSVGRTRAHSLPARPPTGRRIHSIG